MTRFFLFALLFVLPATGAAAQEPALASSPAGRAVSAGSISAARELYASARYDEALALLNGMRPVASDERKAVEQYRSLCLLALGRGDEAAAAIAAVITADPFYQPSEAEASPRVRSTFAEVRQRLLPDLATDRYAAAKRAYDGKDFATAALRFRELVVMMDDPQMNGRLNDLRTLAAGFVELASAAAAPPPGPKEEAKEEAKPKPEPAKVAGPAVPAIYTAEEPGIVPPVTIRQEVPPVPAAISRMAQSQALVDVVIDEQGRLASIALRTSLHPVYDSLLVNAARGWKYQPATVNGVPVQFRKVIQLSIGRR